MFIIVRHCRSSNMVVNVGFITEFVILSMRVYLKFSEMIMYGFNDEDQLNMMMMVVMVLKMLFMGFLLSAYAALFLLLLYCCIVAIVAIVLF